MNARTGLVAVFLLCPTFVAFAQQAPEKQNRAALEQQLRERAAQITRQRLGLNDAQMQRLQQVNGRFAPQLTALATQERSARRQLRQQLTAETQPDQAKVSDLIDTSLRLQKQRIALIEAEQKELAAFLTPVQRARYIALQAQFRNRADQLSRQNPGRGVRGGRRRPAPE
jgi:hypothetical protein